MSVLEREMSVLERFVLEREKEREMSALERDVCIREI